MIGIMGLDVHILDRRWMEYYFQLLRGDSFLSRCGPPPQTFNDICRSMTIYVTNPSLPSRPCTTEPETEKLLSDVLYQLKIHDALPNLKKLKVLFQNVSCDDIYQFHRFIDFPSQVEDLELEYTFTTPVPRWMVPVPHFLASGSNPSWILPSVKHLRIVGGFEDLMKTVFVCPKIEIFEMESCLYWDMKSRKEARDHNLVRTLFFRGLPHQYEDLLKVSMEGQSLLKLFVFTEEPVKTANGVLTYHWWLSHDFALGDITDYESVQYVACKADDVGHSLTIV